MSTTTRVAGFLAGIAALFGASFAVGSAVGPVADEPPTHEEAGAHGAGGEDGGHDDGGHAEPVSTEQPPGGLMTSQDGYRLVLDRPQQRPGDDMPLAFHVEGPDGLPVTAYDVEHEKQLHLIAVRRDFRGFQHVHPVLGADGTWRVPLDLTPGPWRVFADFKPTGGEALTLGADLSVPGAVEATTDLPDTRVATVDGYTVALTGDLVAGKHSTLTLEVSTDGEPVTDLQPYLGAYGHLVALREGDLAYLHVHPGGEPGDGVTEPGPSVEFAAEVPSAGGYHLYLDFRHDGVVRTAQLALEATRP